MKPKRPQKEVHSDVVAPHVGAWVETPDFRTTQLSYFVAPHVGAWVET